jgi:hypothetical protein
MAAIGVLAASGAKVSRVCVPAHHDVRTAQTALTGEGALAVFKTGFFGAFTRTYYPASLIATINQMWASHADVLAPRTKLSLITAEMSRRNYNGRVYAKAQNVRPTFIKAYDTALADVDVLVMPTCLITAPKNYRPESYYEALEDNLMASSSIASKNTQPFNYTGHPALAMPVGKSSAGLPVSVQLVGRFFDDPLCSRWRTPTSTPWTGTSSSQSNAHAVLARTELRLPAGDEDGDLPCRALLILGVRRVGGDGALPPLGALIAAHLTYVHLERLRTILNHHLVRTGLQVVVPDGVLGRAAHGRHQRVFPAVLDPHQRNLADRTRLVPPHRHDDHR